jgi:hypothetical protein
VEFSIRFTMTHGVQAAIDALPKTAWTPAIEADGSVRDDVVEITGRFPSRLFALNAAWPELALTGIDLIA